MLDIFLSGSSLADGGDRYNPRTGSGKEELRAAGLDNYRYSVTKKTFRELHPCRTRAASAHEVQATSIAKFT
nr:hypothetical protein pPsy0462c_00069 [Pseudomonas syringae]